MASGRSVTAMVNISSMLSPPGPDFTTGGGLATSRALSQVLPTPSVKVKNTGRYVKASKSPSQYRGWNAGKASPIFIFFNGCSAIGRSVRMAKPWLPPPPDESIQPPPMASNHPPPMASNQPPPMPLMTSPPLKKQIKSSEDDTCTRAHCACKSQDRPHPDLPYRSLNGLLDAACARPGQLTLASLGVAAAQHIAFELLKRV